MTHVNWGRAPVSSESEFEYESTGSSENGMLTRSEETLSSAMKLVRICRLSLILLLCCGCT